MLRLCSGSDRNSVRRRVSVSVSVRTNVSTHIKVMVKIHTFEIRMTIKFIPSKFPPV